MDLKDRGAFEQWCKTWSSPMLRVLDKYWLTLDPDDDSLTPCLVRDGYWESWVSLAIAKAIRSGWSCVDAGANVGWFTLLMLASGASRVAAVEPHPRVFHLLNNTMVANGLQNIVRLSRVALGAMPGKGTLNEYNRKIGSSGLLKAEGFDVARTYEVDVVPLDLVLSSWKEIDFVKIDVEGMEREVWRGMEDIRSRCGPIVCMEIHDRHGYDVNEFLEEIRRDGYEAKAIGEDGSLVEPNEFRPWTLWLTRR